MAGGHSNRGVTGHGTKCPNVFIQSSFCPSTSSMVAVDKGLKVKSSTRGRGIWSVIIIYKTMGV